MLHEDEVLMFFLGLGVLIFILANRAHLKSFPASKVLIAAFLFLFASWIFTILEGFFLENLLNYLDHICFTVGSVAVAVWCWKVFGKSKEAG
ncbi:MAG: hypothetical protein WBB86_04025 [Candidatus Omnitrophota bacterium]